MASFNTPLTRLLRIRTPVVLAPMGGASGGLLASQVSLAGGFGFFSPDYTSLSSLSSQFDIARKALDVPTGPLPIGVGFLGWRLDRGPRDPKEPHHAQFDLALSQQVRAIWLSFGNDLLKWVDRIRSHDAAQSPPRKTIIFVQVGSVSEAIRAANEWKVDVIVAQGNESGGHGSSTAPPLLTLLPSIIRAFPSGHAPPILAAGGLTNPEHVATLLTLGASGTVHGTLFLPAPASLYTSTQKKAILAADDASTIRSYAFDLLRGTTGWPTAVDGRGLAVSSVVELEGMKQDVVPEGVDLEEARKQMNKRGEEVVWAGTGVGTLNGIREAADIVRELHDGALEALRAASGLVSGSDQT
ncbi:2-nitropropane dioxygenase [Amylostereum chailletii]|nr:2-nitropropane dioxygenase [Amylostereum chailletii]